MSSVCHQLISMLDCRLRMAQDIQRQLEEMEVKQKVLEEKGVDLERAMRGEDTGEMFS